MQNPVEAQMPGRDKPGITFPGQGTSGDAMPPRDRPGPQPTPPQPTPKKKK